jgi:multisubunit Na+/H+ antiporter MnhB subunit
MAPPDQLYRGVTRIFAVIIVGFGVAILVITLANGGGPLSSGFLIGLLFTALGVARLYLTMRSGS